MNVSVYKVNTNSNTYATMQAKEKISEKLKMKNYF